MRAHRHWARPVTAQRPSPALCLLARQSHRRLRRPCSATASPLSLPPESLVGANCSPPPTQAEAPVQPPGAQARSAPVLHCS